MVLENNGNKNENVLSSKILAHLGKFLESRGLNEKYTEVFKKILLLDSDNAINNLEKVFPELFKSRPDINPEELLEFGNTIAAIAKLNQHLSKFVMIYSLPALLRSRPDINPMELLEFGKIILKIASFDRESSFYILAGSLPELFNSRKNIQLAELAMCVKIVSINKFDSELVLGSVILDLFKSKPQLSTEQFLALGKMIVEICSSSEENNKLILKYFVTPFLESKQAIDLDEFLKYGKAVLEIINLDETTAEPFLQNCLPILLRLHPKKSPEELLKFGKLFIEIAKLDNYSSLIILQHNLPNFFKVNPEMTFEELSNIKEVMSKVKPDLAEISYRVKFLDNLQCLLLASNDFKSIMNFASRNLRRDLVNIDLFHSVFNSKLNPNSNNYPLLKIFFKNLVRNLDNNRDVLINLFRFLNTMQIYSPENFHILNKKFEVLIRNRKFWKFIRVLEDKNSEVDKEIFNPEILQTFLPEGEKFSETLNANLTTYINNKEARQKGTVGKKIKQEIVEVWIKHFNEVMDEDIVKLVEMLLGIPEKEKHQYSLDKMKSEEFLLALKVFTQHLKEKFAEEDLKTLLQKFLQEFARTNNDQTLGDYVAAMQHNKEFFNLLTPQQKKVWLDKNEVTKVIEIKYSKENNAQIIIKALSDFQRVANQKYSEKNPGKTLIEASEEDLKKNYNKYFEKFKRFVDLRNQDHDAVDFRNALGFDNEEELENFIKGDLALQLNPVLEAKENPNKSVVKSECTFELENDPREVLNMGTYFTNSCLHPDKFNSWGIFTNAIDLNKRILWIKDKDKKVIGRVLIGLVKGEDGQLNMCRYRTYGVSQIENEINEYLANLQERLNVGTTMDDPAQLSGLEFYKDGTTEF